jgi:predicted ribosomally synthesized peptide with nif11-like leader
MENIKKFYEALTSDTAMQERANKLNATDKPKDDVTALAVLVKFAAQEGYKFSAEELKAYIKENSKGELGDDVLESVAGGLSCFLAGRDICGCDGFGYGETEGCGCFLIGIS